MTATTQHITAEQGSVLQVSLTGSANTLTGRNLLMHVRRRIGDVAIKLSASTTDGRLAITGANAATLEIPADVMAAVSVDEAKERWVYDIESYTDSTDVTREWQGTFTITRDVTRSTESAEDDRLAGVVRYDTTQTLTDAQKLQARENIGAGTGGSGGAWGGITGTLSDQTDLQSALDAKQAASATLTTLSSATAAGLALLDDADAAAQRTTLGLGTAATAATGDFEAAGAVSAHVGQADPHTQYALESSLGGAALLNVGTTTGTVAAGDDSRLSDARTPTAHAASHATAGSDPIAPADIGAAAASHTHAASDITSGTLDAARLPAPGTTTLGGVKRNTGSAGQFVNGVDTDGSLLFGTPSGSGGGTKTLARFTPADNQPPASGFATLDTRNSVLVLDFDDATVESAVFVGTIPEGANLASGLLVRAHWAATSATSGNVRWRAEWEADGTDLDSDSFDTATEAHSAANGTSGIETVTEITCTTIDSLAAGDRYRLKISRVGNDGTNDTMSGDAELVAVEVRQVA